MSDKEAKLAAARKRAEALKAKKAQQVGAESVEDSKDTSGEQQTSTKTEKLTPEDEESQKEFQQEIDRLQNLLDESNLQQESLRKELESSRSSFKTGLDEARSKIVELEGIVARRDEQVHTFELDISTLRQEKDAWTTSKQEMQQQIADLEEERNGLQAERKDSSQTDELRAQLESLQSDRAESDTNTHRLKSEIEQSRSFTDALKKEIKELRASQSVSAGASETREGELQSKTSTLQAENQGLIEQLSELRARLVSIQDEKFALGESVERLQKEVKTSRASSKNSGEVPRARISRDFDRSASLQDVPLIEAKAPRQRDPKNPPADLRSNIQIDLTSWYDKHAGEVIEV